MNRCIFGGQPCSGEINRTDSTCRRSRNNAGLAAYATCDRYTIPFAANNRNSGSHHHSCGFSGVCPKIPSATHPAPPASHSASQTARSRPRTFTASGGRAAGAGAAESRGPPSDGVGDDRLWIGPPGDVGWIVTSWRVLQAKWSHLDHSAVSAEQELVYKPVSGTVQMRRLVNDLRVPPQKTWKNKGVPTEFNMAHTARQDAAQLDPTEGVRCEIDWLLILDTAGRKWETGGSRGGGAKRLAWHHRTP